MSLFQRPLIERFTVDVSYVISDVQKIHVLLTTICAGSLILHDCVYMYACDAPLLALCLSTGMDSGAQCLSDHHAEHGDS